MAPCKYFLFILLITVVATDEDSREMIISKITKLQILNRGQFAQTSVDNESLETLSDEELPKLQRSIEVEIVCSYTYNMLYHMRLTELSIYDFSTSMDLYYDIEQMYPWARDMLVHVFNMNIDKKRRYADTFFLFHLYLKRISTHMESDNDEARNFFDGLHEMRDIMFGNLYVTLRDNGCSMYNHSTGEKRDVKLYLIDIENETPNWENTFDKLKEDCEQIKYNIDNSVIEIPGDFFNLDPLHLENTVDRSSLMNNLVTIFGEIDIGFNLQYTMVQIFDVIKSARSSFKQYMKSVGNLHVCFVQMLNTIILKIFLQHLAYLKNTPQSNRPLENKMFYRQLKKYAKFIEINEKVNENGKSSQYLEDNFGYLIYTFKTESEIPISSQIIADLEMQTANLLEKIRTILKNIAKLDRLKYSDSSVTTVPMIDLKSFAESNSISFNPNSPESVMCAEVFVNIVNTELKFVNYKVIRSLIGLPKTNILNNGRQERYTKRNP